MIILVDGVRYKLIAPDREATLEKHVRENYKDIFGQDSIWFDKKKIKSKSGIGTIPDAFVITFDHKPRWYVVEVELASHPVYNHVFPQLTKFKRAIEDSSSRRKIVDFFYDSIKQDAVLEAQIKKKIGSGEIYKLVSDLVSENPTIVVVIDERTEQLEEVLLDFGTSVKVVEFKTYRRDGVSEEINAYTIDPVIKAYRKASASKVTETKVSRRAGTITDAIYSRFDDRGIENVSYEECRELAQQVKPDTAFNKGHFSWYKNHYKKKSRACQGSKVIRNVRLPQGLNLHNTYKGIRFTAKVIDNEKINFNGEVFNSLSLAAIAAIQSTGSNRETENGWTWWRFVDPETGEEKPIDDLRKK